ncbi:MAG: hypothetical protein ACREN2_11135 [Candidatus Dormibacteria bacterium]
MASDVRARHFRAAALGATAAALAVLAGGVGAAAASPWWTPVGLRGTAIRDVGASGETIVVRTASGEVLRSTDRGAHFAPAPGAQLPQVAVTSGNYMWTIADGTVVRQRGASAPQRDPGSPDLGPNAHLIAAPAALPGVVVAVGGDGTVWRRGQDGDWKQALLLLNQSLVQGVPRITSLTAFAQPLSNAVYLSTDGYAVLISTDGGDDWIRAGPGLPDTVNALAADSGAKSVYAATTDGLWVHTLQAFPAPPHYTDQALVYRWLGIAAVTLVAAVVAVLVMLRLTPARRP